MEQCWVLCTLSLLLLPSIAEATPLRTTSVFQTPSDEGYGDLVSISVNGDVSLSRYNSARIKIEFWTYKDLVPLASVNASYDASLHRRVIKGSGIAEDINNLSDDEMKVLDGHDDSDSGAAGNTSIRISLLLSILACCLFGHNFRTLPLILAVLAVVVAFSTAADTETPTPPCNAERVDVRVFIPQGCAYDMMAQENGRLMFALRGVCGNGTAPDSRLCTRKSDCEADQICLHAGAGEAACTNVTAAGAPRISNVTVVSSSANEQCGVGTSFTAHINDSYSAIGLVQFAAVTEDCFQCAGCDDSCAFAFLTCHQWTPLGGEPLHEMNVLCEQSDVKDFGATFHFIVHAKGTSGLSSYAVSEPFTLSEYVSTAPQVVLYNGGYHDTSNTYISTHSDFLQGAYDIVSSCGIKEIHYAAGTSKCSHDVLPWVMMDHHSGNFRVYFNRGLDDGDYYLSLLVVNNAGVSSTVCGDRYVVDSDGPILDLTTTCDGKESGIEHILLGWDITDSQSQVSAIHWAAGDVNMRNISDWSIAFLNGDMLTTREKDKHLSDFDPESFVNASFLLLRATTELHVTTSVGVLKDVEPPGGGNVSFSRFNPKEVVIAWNGFYDVDSILESFKVSLLEFDGLRQTSVGQANVPANTKAVLLPGHRFEWEHTFRDVPLKGGATYVAQVVAVSFPPACEEATDKQISLPITVEKVF